MNYILAILPIAPITLALVAIEAVERLTRRRIANLLRDEGYPHSSDDIDVAIWEVQRLTEDRP